MASIRVVCRFRPQNKIELGQGGKSIINLDPSGGTVKIKGSESDHTFTFDRVFPPDVTQREVYEDGAKPVIEDVMQGYNGTLFVYGQTSSGKTHTMQGPSIDDAELKGIIPRMINTVFEAVMNADENIEFLVKASYLEIYMEHIRDLLDTRKDNLKIREEKSKGIWVEGATEVYVSKEQDVLDIIRTGQSNRAIAFTKMNAESSRSHSIFVLNISQKNLKDGSSKAGKLYLVDLAGSEKVGKTGAQGSTLDEAKMINKSLSALGNVINALTDGKSGHIPYRDSKLTRILQESLGGNSRTTLIINCSPSSYNEAETLSTLRFGNRAKSIKNKAKVNQERSAAELKALLAKAEAEIERLKAYIKAGGGNAEPARAATADPGTRGPGTAALQEKCLDLEQQLANAEDEKKGTQEQLDSLNDTLQEKEAEVAAIRVELESLTLEVQTLTKENGQLSMQFADMKMTADRVRYESTEQALVIETLTTENSVVRGELQLLQDQIKTLQEEQTLREQDEDSSVTSTAHANTKSNPVKRYSTEWAQKEEELKRALEDGFRSEAGEVPTTTPPESVPSAEVQARITELEEAIKTRDAQFEEAQQNYQSSHTVLTSQHSQLQHETTDLRSRIKSRDSEIELLKAKLEETNTKLRLKEQQDQQSQYRRDQESKWQGQKANQTVPSDEPAEQHLLEELSSEEPEQSTETPTEEPQEKLDSELTNTQAAELERLIAENNLLRSQLLEVPREPVDMDKYKEMEDENTNLRSQMNHLEATTKANEDLSKAKLETEIKRLQNQTSVKLAEFASMRDALLLDLENRCQKVVDLEMLLDDAQDKYHNLLAQMKKAGGKQQHYELLQQKLDLATSARHQLSIDNNKLKLDLQVATKQLALRDGHISSLESLLKDTQERFHKLAKGYETVAAELAKFKEGNAGSGSSGGLFGRVRTSSINNDNMRIARPLRGGGGHHAPSTSIAAAISSASPPPRANGSATPFTPPLTSSNSLTSLPPMPSPFSIGSYTATSSSPMTSRTRTDSPGSTPGSNSPYGSGSQNSIWDIFRAKKGTPKPSIGSPSSTATPSTPQTPITSLPSYNTTPATPSTPFTPLVLPTSGPATPITPTPANQNSYAPAVPTSPFTPPVTRRSNQDRT